MQSNLRIFCGDYESKDLQLIQTTKEQENVNEREAFVFGKFNLATVRLKIVARAE